MVGDGELREALLAQCRDLNLTVRSPWTGNTVTNPRAATEDHGVVHFVGLRRDVPRLLSAMDIFALPSLNEGMGRVLVEAMAMELPCVASRVSGTPDVVRDGVTGMLVPPSDAEQLAGALSALTNDPVQARVMGRRGRECVIPAMSEGVMVEKLAHLYRTLLAEKGIAMAGSPA